jgi:hypothetical protein
MREAALILHAPSAGTRSMGQVIVAYESIRAVRLGDGLPTWCSDMHTGGFASR